jgi:hypothetical protein
LVGWFNLVGSTWLVDEKFVKLRVQLVLLVIGLGSRRGVIGGGVPMFGRACSTVASYLGFGTCCGS